MYCHKCGTRVPDDSIYCWRCGIRLVTSAVVSTPQRLSETAQPMVIEATCPQAMQEHEFTFLSKLVTVLGQLGFQFDVDLLQAKKDAESQAERANQLLTLVRAGVGLAGGGVAGGFIATLLRLDVNFDEKLVRRALDKLKTVYDLVAFKVVLMRPVILPIVTSDRFDLADLERRMDIATEVAMELIECGPKTVIPLPLKSGRSLAYPLFVFFDNVRCASLKPSFGKRFAKIDILRGLVVSSAILDVSSKNIYSAAEQIMEAKLPKAWTTALRDWGDRMEQSSMLRSYAQRRSREQIGFSVYDLQKVFE